jgi:RNA polymerase sigma factor (sigma-70 family)
MTEFPSGEQSTCWTLIGGAAAGESTAKEAFARRYQRVVLAYLRARWARGPLIQDAEDALQEVFLECFKGGGALSRVDREKGSSFRGYLLSVVRNVASRYEERRGRRPDPLSTDAAAHARVEEEPDRAYLREWARSVVEEAANLQADQARLLGQEARVRMKILQMRFVEGMPIREIAPRVQMSAEETHREYARARREFELALKSVVAFDTIGGDAAVEEECRQLLAALRGP